MNVCITCKFWLTTGHAGQCRRNPPQIVTRVYTDGTNENVGRYEPAVESKTEAEWPETKANDWCGGHASK